jgi:cytidylate kinase
MIKGYYVPDGKTVRVAISGRSGCGNTTVSRILAESLDIAFINYTFRSLAQEMRIPLEEIIERAKTDFTFDRLVDSKQVELARLSSCVLGSRLAIWMLPEADLKVYLTASEQVRTKRIVNREGGSFEDTLRFTAMRDSEDTRRYRELYDIDNTSYDFADLIVDTELFSPDQIAVEVLETLADKGLIARE